MANNIISHISCFGCDVLPCSNLDSANVVGGSYFMYVWELPIFIIMGCGAGLMGSAFVVINVRLNRLRDRFMPWSKAHLRGIEVKHRALSG